MEPSQTCHRIPIPVGGQILALPLLAGLCIFGAAAAQPADSGPLTERWIMAAPRAELAERLLPPELVPKVVSHWVQPPMGLQGPLVHFFGAPDEVRPGICRRYQYFLQFYRVINAGNGRAPLDVPLRPMGPYRITEVAVSPDCRQAHDAGFVQPS